MFDDHFKQENERTHHIQRADKLIFISGYLQVDEDRVYQNDNKDKFVIQK
jgi:hypothetical protein